MGNYFKKKYFSMLSNFVTSNDWSESGNYLWNYPQVWNVLNLLLFYLRVVLPKEADIISGNSFMDGKSL